MMGMAQHAIDQGNIPAAFEFYEACLQRDGRNVEVLEAYGEMMLHHGDPKAAERMLLHAVAIDPNHGHVKYLNLGQLTQGHTSLGHYESACTVLLQELAKSRTAKQRAIISRTISTAKVAIAELFLTDLCDEPDAEQRCEAAVTDAEMYCKDNIEVHQTRGNLRLSQERPEEAAIALKEAVRLTHIMPEQFQPPYESKLELGKLLMQVDPRAAFNFFLELLQLDDSDPYVWFLLGESARLKGAFGDSARLLRHARVRVEAANVGPEALAEVDTSIRLLVEAIGVEAVNQIPHMNEPNPLEHLEDNDDTGDDEEAAEGEDDADPDAGWEDFEG